MNLRKIKRKYWLSLLMSPLTLIPFMGGVTSFFVFGALGKMFQACLLLLGGLVVGTGCLFSNALVRGEKFLEKAKKEAAEEDKEKRESALDELDAQLALDRDRRTNRALKDLRALAKAFRTEFEWGDSSSKHAASELLSLVNGNFKQCVKSLKASLRLYRTIKNVESEGVRDSLSKKREAIVEKVQNSVRNLTTIFEQMQELSAAADPSAELSRHSDELTRQLTLMKRIDERTKALDKQVGLGQYDDTTAEDDWLDDLELE